MGKMNITLRRKLKEDMVTGTKDASKKDKVNPIILYVAAMCLMIGLSFYFVSDALALGAQAAAETFSKTKDVMAEATYDSFYSTAFEYSERKHHVSNATSINIGQIREVQELEVLKVYDISYEISKEDDEVESWLEVPGYGVFTVDLRMSEFIIDNVNQYVLVRVASPVLSQFTLDHAGIKPLYFDEDWFHDATDGINMAEEQVKNAETNLRISMMNNQSNYQRAEQSAQTILVNMVRQLNPQLPDLFVDVEFIK